MKTDCMPAAARLWIELLKPALLVGIVAASVLIPRSTASASHDLFAYKFPCKPADACYVTQLAHGADALDIDPRGSPGLGDIPAVSEGIFVGYFIQSPVCDELGGAGKYAVVEDMHGRTILYGHLSRFGSLQPGQRVLQGEHIGVEGDTGHTHWFPGGVHTPCADHIHLGGVAAAAGIDGISMPSLTAGPTLYSSTNAAVGAYSIPGGAIRDKYFDEGAVYTSWAAVGWPSDRTGNNAGCGAVSNCRLYVHHDPDPLAGHWGSKQDFKDHPDGDGFLYSTIAAGRWAPNEAYLIRKAFDVAWIFGGNPPGATDRYPIGLPLMDEIGRFPGLCDEAAGCLYYQRFHLGYVWRHETDGLQPAVFCPDVFPPYPDQDYSATTADVMAIAQAFGRFDSALPHEPWLDAWYDLNGDGAIDTGDIDRAVKGFGAVCYPTE